MKLERGERLWFLNNHTGRIEYITVSRAGRQDFSFQNKRRTYRAGYASIGVKYFKDKESLLENQRQRAELKNMPVELPEPEEARDITITCADCGSSFLFTVREQEFYAEKGFRAPVRCRACREKRRKAAEE